MLIHLGIVAAAAVAGGEPFDGAVQGRSGDVDCTPDDELQPLFH